MKDNYNFPKKTALSRVVSNEEADRRARAMIESGEPLTNATFLKYKLGDKLVKRIWGGRQGFYEEYAEEYGLTPPVSKNNHKATEAEMLAELHRIHDKHGYITQSLINSESPWTFTIVFRKLGTLAEIAEREGFTYYAGSVYTPNFVDDNILRIFDRCTNTNSDPQGKAVYRVLLNDMKDIKNFASMLKTSNFPEQGSWLGLFQLLTGIHLETEKSFSDLVNPSTGKKLRFDGVNRDLNLLIEYQTLSHYSSNSSSSKEIKSFNELRERDELKRNWAYEHGWNYYEVDCRDNPFSRDYIYTLASSIEKASGVKLDIPCNIPITDVEAFFVYASFKNIEFVLEDRINNAARTHIRYKPSKQDIEEARKALKAEKRQMREQDILNDLKAVYEKHGSLTTKLIQNESSYPLSTVLSMHKITDWKKMLGITSSKGLDGFIAFVKEGAGEDIETSVSKDGFTFDAYVPKSGVYIDYRKDVPDEAEKQGHFGDKYVHLQHSNSNFSQKCLVRLGLDPLDSFYKPYKGVNVFSSERRIYLATANTGKKNETLIRIKDPKRAALYREGWIKTHGSVSPLNGFTLDDLKEYGVDRWEDYEQLDNTKKHTV